MKLKLKIALYLNLVTLCCIIPISAHALLIGFEDLSWGDAVTNQYPEVTFSSVPGIDNHATFARYTGFGETALCSGPYAIVGGCVNDTVLTFTSYVENLTFWAIGVNDLGLAAQIDIYEKGILSSTVPIMGLGDSSTPQFVDLTEYTSVSSIRLHSIRDYAGIGWDNFEFDMQNASVPLPGSLILMLLAIFTLRFMSDDMYRTSQGSQSGRQ